jgi:hypothetical protein
VTTSIKVVLEIGSKRVFASAIDWPGWSRGGRTEADAMQTLAAYAGRYREAIAGTERARELQSGSLSFVVVDRVKGDASTDYGVPGKPLTSDDRPLTGTDLEQWIGLLDASWQAFAQSARAARGKRLRTGPRGGGRTVAKMVDHVIESEAGYLAQLDRAKAPNTPLADPAHERQLHKTIVESLRRRAAGEMPELGRRLSPFWTPRYFIRRTAWHALDHAWEIEDRAEGG